MIVRGCVRQLDLPLRRPLHAAHGSHDPGVRSLVVVELEDHDGIVGWGECSALERPGYGTEWTDDAFGRLARWIADGRPVDEHRPDPATHPFTAAAMAAAELDIELRRAGTSLADHLGASSDRVEIGVAVGAPTTDVTVAEAVVAARRGVRRVKVKIAPDDVTTTALAVRQELDASVAVHVDANGSLGAGHHAALVGLAAEGVDLIEQPFPRGNLVAAAALIGAGAPVAADEAATDIEAIRRLAGAGAATTIVVKPGRFGSPEGAARAVAWCGEHGLGVAAGGMRESGLGRHLLTVIAALPGITAIGDTAPADDHLAIDPWPSPVVTDGTVPVPDTPGIAPPPDPVVLAEVTRRWVGRTG